MLGTITLTVGQTDAMPQKEESPEMTEELQEEVCPQVNGEQEEKESEKITAAEEKAEEKPNESNEVGFKKIFRFVGFKFTLKKDKNEKTEPVQLLTVKETENGASDATAEATKEEAITGAQSEKEKVDAEEEEKKETNERAADPEATLDLPAADATEEDTTDGAAGAVETPTEQAPEEVVTPTEKEKEATSQPESSTTPQSQETQSTLRRFFTQGIFSNLRKKTSFKKSKEDEAVKEKSVEEDIKETEEKEEEAVTDGEQVKEVVEEVATGEVIEEVETGEVVEEAATGEQTEKTIPEETQSNTEEQKKEQQQLNVKPETANKVESVQEPGLLAEVTTCEVSEATSTNVKDEIKCTDDKPTEDKAADSTQEDLEKSTAETTTEAEAVSSQDKVKPQGSPLKKLFTGAGLKKLSSKKQKTKKEAESKLTESGEQTSEQLQSSTEVKKPDSGASSPEDSGEHVVGEEPQVEAHAEVDSENATSDSERKKDGILPWASFKKLVTPKKRVKRPSESEDEATGDKPKSATMSSAESAVFEEKAEEIKPSEEVKEEAKEESQDECKPETKNEKPEQGTEEPKRKIDTSVPWEALICVGSAKKRARKTSDSDEEEAKIEEEVQKSGEEQAKTTESAMTSSQEADHENLASSPEPEGESVSTWKSIKRFVTPRKKPKAEDKSDEGSAQEQTLSDSEIPKEESSFSLRNLIPRRKKKSEAKQGQTSSSDVGSAEEDSETPAVVPLSEYDNEQSEASADVAKTEETNPEVVAAVTPSKASAEERSPSWISAAVEDVKDDADEKQLSDIPEEGDTAATPKSTDNTIAEDIAEFTSEAVTALELAEETEMVSALSRITESPVTSGETSPVPADGVVKKTDKAVENISITTCSVASTETEENTKSTVAIKKEAIVPVAHDKCEATAICTSFNTSEIKVVQKESPLKVSLEAVDTVGAALPVEVAPENQTLTVEKAAMAEDKVFAMQINEVQTEYKENHETPIENAVEKLEKVEALVEPSVAQVVDELQEVTPVKVAVVTAVHQEPETLEVLVLTENSPKEAESPIETTIESAVCAQTVEVTELAVAEGESLQELKDVEESVASVEVTPVEGAVAVAEEIATSIEVAPVTETALSQEDSITLMAPTEDCVVTEEAICVGSSKETTTEEVVTATVLAEEHIHAVSSKSSDVIEETTEKVEEEIQLSQATHVREAEAIQEQSTVIVREVIQSVVENLGEILDKPVEGMQEQPNADVRTSSETAEESNTDFPVKDDKPLLVQEEKSNEPAEEAKSTTVEQVHEEKPTEPENRPEQGQTQIITEKSPAAVSEAIQVSETVLISMTEEIAAQQEVASMSDEPTQQSTGATKQDTELKECEVKVQEEKIAGTECEDGKSQVTEDVNEVIRQSEQATTETPAPEVITQEESNQVKEASASTTQALILEVASQEVQGIQIEKTTEISVDIIHVVDADEEAEQGTVKEDSSISQEPEEDVAETILDEAQQDKKSEDESRDAVSQKSEAEACEMKTATEAMEKATKEEVKENDPVSTDNATMS